MNNQYGIDLCYVWWFLVSKTPAPLSLHSLFSSSLPFTSLMSNTLFLLFSPSGLLCTSLERLHMLCGVFHLPGSGMGVVWLKGTVGKLQATK